MGEPEIDVASEPAAPYGRPLDQRVKIAAATIGLFTEVLAMVYVADVMTDGQVTKSLAKTFDRIVQAPAGWARRTLGPYTSHATLAARHLVWDATEAVWDADPEWYRRAVA